jgi:hypothetical protein
MAYRLLGAIVLLGCIGAAGYGLWGLLQTSDMVSVLPAVAPEVDAKDWALHWRASTSALLLAGCFGICAGLGLIFKKRMALAFLTAICCVWLALQFGAAILKFSRYPFEALDPVEIILVSVVALGTFLAYRSERQSSNA